jgi:hypothetical protein
MCVDVWVSMSIPRPWRDHNPIYTSKGASLGSQVLYSKKRCLASHVTAYYVVDSCLLTSRREPRPRGCPYARALEGEATHAVVIVTALGYGSKAAYGMRHRPGV